MKKKKKKKKNENVLFLITAVFDICECMYTPDDDFDTIILFTQQFVNQSLQPHSTTKKKKKTPSPPPLFHL